MISKNIWLFGRIILLITGAASIIFAPHTTNINWPSCFLIFAASALFPFLWLTGVESRSDIDYSSPFSFTKPFLPMQKYPIQYVLMLALTPMLGGGGVLLEEYTKGGEEVRFGATFFFIGLGMLLSLYIFLTVH